MLVHSTQLSSSLLAIADMGLGSQIFDNLLLGYVTNRVLVIQKMLAPINISTILGAFAEMDIKPEARLVAQLTLRVTKNVKAFDAKHIAVTVWAYAKLDLAPSPSILARLSKRQPHMLTGNDALLAERAAVNGVVREQGGNKAGEASQHRLVADSVANSILFITLRMGQMVTGLTEQAVTLKDTFSGEQGKIMS